MIVGDQDAGDEWDRHQTCSRRDLKPNLDASVAAALDCERAADEQRALTHPAQTAVSVRRRRFGHPSSVVDDLENDAVDARLERDIDLRRLGVAGDVGQALLGDPVDGELRFV